MSSFSVSWKRVRLEWRKHAERAPWAQEAILRERVLLDRGQANVAVCRIAHVFEKTPDQGD
jgi:hypothetical protein